MKPRGSLYMRQNLTVSIKYLKNHLKTHQLTKEEIAALLPAATSTLTIPTELQ